MAKRIKTQPCSECGGVMRYEKHDDVLEHKGHERTIRTLGWWCTSCGEGILSGEALLAHDKAFRDFKAEVDGVLKPADVARIRKALGLSQRKAGQLLGGGPRAFQKYEAGSQAMSVPMSNCSACSLPTRLGCRNSSRPKGSRQPKRAELASGLEMLRGASGRTARPGSSP